MFLIKWWKKYQRHLDRKFLWPTIKNACILGNQTLETAHIMMLFHATYDPAYNDLSPEQLEEYVKKLE